MEEIRFFDRYTRQERVEKIYGDGALRWTYGTPLGKLALATVVKRSLFSRLYGWRMDRPKSRELIEPFIRDYELDPTEFALRPDQFRNFNEFFARALVPEARPIDADDDSVVFPADGRHLCVPDLSSCEGLFVKGQMFDLTSLLEDDELTDRFAGGSLLLSRLCPVDYHRFHFPLAGRPGAARLINGPLYSVNPIALCQNIHILATNKRSLTELQTERFGSVLLMEVGATCVGSIRQTYQPEAGVAKGDEKGFFRFGGSSTITMFQPGVIRFADDLVEQSSRRRELYARMGDVMGYRR